MNWQQRDLKEYNRSDFNEYFAKISQF
uniref:Uncharacterized protein n=1 Tax=Physcomitrium patens TaxID=3218 RepID=A0A2K1L395_PHYPA|nr:hypothetical protein PHYPA_003291 [Physcomitrium patens]